MSLRTLAAASALLAAGAALTGCSTGSTQDSEPTTTPETKVDEGA